MNICEPNRADSLARDGVGVLKSGSAVGRRQRVKRNENHAAPGVVVQTHNVRFLFVQPDADNYVSTSIDIAMHLRAYRHDPGNKLR